MSLKDYLLGQENHLEDMEKKLHFTKGYGFLTAATAPFDRHILMAEELYKDQPRLTKEIVLKNRTILVNGKSGRIWVFMWNEHDAWSHDCGIKE